MPTALKVLVGIVVGWSAGISIATIQHWPNFTEPHNWLALIIFFGPGLWVINRWAKNFQRRAERMKAEMETGKRAGDSPEQLKARQTQLMAEWKAEQRGEPLTP